MTPRHFATLVTLLLPVGPLWIWRWVDGALLWDELDPPPLLRADWKPLIDHARTGPQEDAIHVGFDHVQKPKREELKERIAARGAGASPGSD